MNAISMARGCILGWFLVSFSSSRRLTDEHVDRVVFGELGDSIEFHAPDLPPVEVWHGREFDYPESFEFGTKVSLVGPEGNRTGFAVKNFGQEDQGWLYSITTNYVATNYTAAIANRVEADIGAALHITPLSDVISSITWKYTSTSTTKSTDFVEVLDHGTFKDRASVNATTGKLCVRQWRSSDDGFFIAEINGKKFAENFKVVSVVRVEPGGDLHLDPQFVGQIDRFSWYRDGALVVEYDFAASGVKYRFPHCLTVSSNCNFNAKTGKLKVKSWQHSYDGEFTMMINGNPCKNRIKVVGDVFFAPYRDSLQLNPPPFTGNLNSIMWQLGGNMLLEYDGVNNVEYYPKCAEIKCIFDTTTGTLTIPDWWPLDTERYTMDVNGKRQPHEYLVAGVAQLDGYDAKLETQSVSEKQTILICDGDFDAAEPVKYFWRLHGSTTWVEGKYMMETINVFVKAGRTTYLYDACKVQNPVSERVITLN